MSEVREALEQIRFENEGRLTPDDVVETAADRSHPLHDFFEWDDSIAGQQHRLWQARALIRSVKVIIAEKSVPAFVNVKVDSLQYYQRAEIVSQNIDEWDSALSLAQQRLLSAQRGVEELNSIAPDKHKPKVAQAAKYAEQAHFALQLAA